jgi:hypothetical protein
VPLAHLKLSAVPGDVRVRLLIIAGMMGYAV